MEKHVRTYHSLLRSGSEIFLRALESSHADMESSLHPQASSKNVDLAAFLYSARRLPDCINRVKLVVIGQNEEVFKRGGLQDIFEWEMVETDARRRRMAFDGKSTLIVFVNSLSDIDDLIPLLTAFQIEWNKMNDLIKDTSFGHDLANGIVMADAMQDELRQAWGLSTEDWGLLQRLWGENWDGKMAAIALNPVDIRVKLLTGGFSNFRRAVQNWWIHLLDCFDDTLIEFRPIYFVSSNTHSLANLLSGFAIRHRESILAHAMANDNEGLRRQWHILEADGEVGPQLNFLYYTMQHYIQSDKEIKMARQEMEEESGIYRFAGGPYLDLDSIIVDMRKIIPERLDPRLSVDDQNLLKKSRAMILNVDYPFGLAAYHLLSQVTASAAEIRGIYILGKAATLSGRVGDVMISNTVLDGLSRNLFFFKNCFSMMDVIDHLHQAAVFDQQKLVTSRGTFLESMEMMRDFHRDGYNGLEMEAGPYLCAIYENLYPERFPMDKSINMQEDDAYDIGMLHYASDTPYSKKASLLDKRLGLSGIESTYACTLAILKRIFEVEIGHVKKQEGIQ